MITGTRFLLLLSLKLRISQNVSAKLSWIKKQLKKSKKKFKKQLHELSEYYIIFSSLKKQITK